LRCCKPNDHRKVLIEPCATRPFPASQENRMMPFRLIRAALREPLVHFVAAGAVLFGIHGLIARDETPAADAARNVVSVSAADVEWLRGGFTRQWHRPPSVEELHMLAADLLREKLLAREAQSLGSPPTTRRAPPARAEDAVRRRGHGTARRSVR
jgi:hypothetical protein